MLMLNKMSISRINTDYNKSKHMRIEEPYMYDNELALEIAARTISD